MRKERQKVGHLEVIFRAWIFLKRERGAVTITNFALKALR
jgi:hypothetical protein